AGIAHNLVNVRIDKRFPGHAYKVGNGLLGLGQMMFAKVILVSDDPAADPKDHQGFWRHVLSQAVPGRDSQFAKGPIDVLDHASRAWSYGSKLIVDGTRKHAEEGGADDFSPNPERTAAELPKRPEVLDQHQPPAATWFLTCDKQRAGQGAELLDWAVAQPGATDGVRLIATLGAEVDPRDFEECMWTLLNNIDPERDIRILNTPDGRPVFAVDATQKLAAEGFTRDWPEKLVMDESVRQRVDEIWPKR
ncbi:MAG: UbiD family decarboxylase, partial [Trueperaceae bacterium]|nr:UbiD family decarboxylase [Trueperaceae bacterium]